MFKLSIILFSFFALQTINAQTKTIPDSLKKSINVNFDDSDDHFMFNITMDNVLDDSKKDSNYNSNIFNPNFGMYYMHDMPLGKKSGWSFAPGIGFTFSKVNLDNTHLYEDTLGTTFVQTKNHKEFGTSKNYDGSSFYSSWIEVPMELRYKSKPLNGRSCIKAAVGFRAGLNLASNAKYSYYDVTLQADKTIKESSFAGLNSLRYGMTFRIGYGAVNLFGYYGLNQLLKDSENYNKLDLRQYSIGVSITGM